LIETYRRETKNPSEGFPKQKKVSQRPCQGPAVEESLIAGCGKTMQSVGQQLAITGRAG